MSIIAKLIAIIVGVAGVAAGIYAGIWQIFIPGIENIINGWNAEPDADAEKVAWGLAQVWIIAPFVGSFIAYAGGFLGYFLWQLGEEE